jgi:hypothetical protein
MRQPRYAGQSTEDVLQRVDLSPLGTPTRDIGQSMGFAAQLSGLLTEREAPIWYARLWNSSPMPGTSTPGSVSANSARSWAFP